MDSAVPLPRRKALYYAFLNVSFLLLLACALAARYLPGTDGRGGAVPVRVGLGGGDGGCEGAGRRRRVTGGYIDYLGVFYCYCQGAPAVGYALLGLWLLVLFYLLGNTASEYFCPSLEGLSAKLGLSPAVAGATLLSLGNGAPDVFASIVSFNAGGHSAGEVGLSSVLGGAFFVSTVVVGVISLSVASRPVFIDRFYFLRDVAFLCAALGALFVLLVAGSVTLGGAACFVSLYIVYVAVVVFAPHCCSVAPSKDDPSAPLLSGKEDLEGQGDGASSSGPETGTAGEESSGSSRHGRRLLWLLALPLYLPRRLTIPVVAKERWSKPFAVASLTTAPLLLAALWASRTGGSSSAQRLGLYLCGGLLGVSLGLTALVTTDGTGPPKRSLLPWLAGGFLMSVVWAYIIAQELVALLVSLGHILGVSPSVLGLTVLAWGDSVGDIIANIALAVNGGERGAQAAVSGCYAGPTFNTLVGLGVSMLWSAWKAHPAPFVIPGKTSLYQTLGFLVAGLLWAAVILPRRGMRLDRVLGTGLLAIYLCFLSLRISEILR